MPLITCALDSIVNPTTCNERAGIKSLYWTTYESIDWTTMAATPAQFDQTNQTILDYAMVGGGVFTKVEFERKGAFYDFTYTQDQGFYENLISLLFRGKDITRRNSLQSAIACCNVVLHIYGNGGEQRVVGVDWDGVVFDNILEKMAVTRHLDSGGQLGTSKGRDELDIGGQSFFAPIWATVDETTIPL